MQIGTQPELALGVQCHDAMVKHAAALNEALRTERLRKRIFAELFLRGDGSVAHREAMARTNPAYIEAEERWVQCESAANLAKAEASGMELRFKAWQSQHATQRAEMNLK
jgi:hypothetical protein